MMLGGLLIWTLHFMGVYIIASVADVVATADDFRWRMGGLAFSALCLLGAVAAGAAAFTALRAGPRDELTRFGAALGLLGAAIGGLGIIFQSLPNLIGF
jgi:hypothetical protein